MFKKSLAPWAERHNMQTMNGVILWTAAFLVWTAIARTAEPVYPVKVSENGRYFIDQKGEPVFRPGTTRWQLFPQFTSDDAMLALESAAS
jgi:hypothetical protein